MPALYFLYLCIQIFIQSKDGNILYSYVFNLISTIMNSGLTFVIYCLDGMVLLTAVFQRRFVDFTGNDGVGKVAKVATRTAT